MELSVSGGRGLSGVGSQPPRPINLPTLWSHPWQKQSRAPKLLHTCVRCRVGKMKCDGTYPCHRCWRLSLPCRIQKGKGTEHLSTVDMVIERTDPTALTELYLRAFRQVQSEGKIERQKAVCMLRTWHSLSLLVGRDITWGIAHQVAHILAITAFEVEGGK
ncbi:hypothetical protein VYU27_006731 [Nannochloropsis oceanica]